MTEPGSNTLKWNHKATLDKILRISNVRHAVSVDLVSHPEALTHDEKQVDRNWYNNSDGGSS